MNPNVKVFTTAGDLAQAAAEEIAGRIRAAIAKKGGFTAALSGGNTPRATYSALAEPKYRNAIDWKRVKLFQVDERLVPPTDPASNFRMIQEALASCVSLSPRALEHFWLEGDDPEAIAAHGEQRLREWFHVPEGEAPRFDLILLGLGADGHTASLFPNSPALAETKRLVVPAEGPQPHPKRVTLTLPVINNAAAVIFLVSGKEKAGTVRAILDPDPAAAPLPAQLVQPASGPPLWLMDAPAASGIQA